jgi:hypothetical protein
VDKKVTKAQQAVLDKMADGWELGYCQGARSPGRFWLQKEGIGRGGECINVRQNVWWNLLQKGLIRLRLDRFPFRYYERVE